MTKEEYAELLKETNGLILCYKDGDNIHPALLNGETAQAIALLAGDVTVLKDVTNRFQKTKEL